jgi:hypothetical protein
MTPKPILFAAALLAVAQPVSAQRGPAPRSTNLPAAALALACAPTLVFDEPAVTLKITGGQDTFARRIYQPGDLVTINAGTQGGIEVGQEFFVRRVQPPSGRSIDRDRPGVVRTAGWLRVYAVDDQMSLATISHACDTIETNDYLEPFVLPVVPEPSPDRPRAERGNYGHVLVGVDRRTTFGRGDFMIVDRGSNQGVTPGAQFVIYRDKELDENFLYELGEAVAVDVKADTSTLLVTVSRDALEAGDYVAQRK